MDINNNSGVFGEYDSANRHRSSHNLESLLEKWAKSVNIYLANYRLFNRSERLAIAEQWDTVDCGMHVIIL